uniref:uncharacterized protein LOC117608854 n=1 Tax=Osmia lignaria TaxID=473952 RepID=UPI0014786E29|nr:uncharacterized protein LOC117608854 [Osmia lignaria]
MANSTLKGKFCMGTWNARSVRGKLSEIKENIKNFDILEITETWLKKKDRFVIPGYNIIRGDLKEDRQGGGLAFVVEESIKFVIRKDVTWRGTGREILGISVETKKGIWDILLVYRRPGEKWERKDWVKLFKNKRPNVETIVMGDFKARSKTWNCHVDSKEGTLLEKVIRDYDMFVINTSTSSRLGTGGRPPSNIDLFIGSHYAKEKATVTEKNETMGSDHQVLGLLFGDEEVYRSTEVGGSTRKFRVDKINWDVFVTVSGEEAKELMGNWNEEGWENFSIDNRCRDLTEAIINIIRKAGGAISDRVSNKNGERRKGKPKNVKGQTWWDNECNEAKKDRREAAKLFIKTPNQDNWINLREVGKRMKKLIEEKKAKAWDDFASSIDCYTSSREAWQKIKQIKNGIGKTGCANLDEKELNLLEELEIGKVFSYEQEGAQDKEGQGEVETPDQFRGREYVRQGQLGFQDSFKERDLQGVLDSVRISSAPGEDGISYLLLRKLDNGMKKCLLKL